MKHNEPKRPKPPSHYDLVHIYWHDGAMHGNNQVSIQEVPEYGIMRGHVAGWLVHETPTFVTIAMDFFPAAEQNSQDSFRTLQSYPKSGIETIVRVKTLKIRQPSRPKPTKATG